MQQELASFLLGLVMQFSDDNISAHHLDMPALLPSENLYCWLAISAANIVYNDR